MEERLILQVKHIYHETKQAISECNFLTAQELDQILLTPNEEELIMKVNGSQMSLIKAATLLRELHARFLRTFVLSAFDLTWDMITTPKRFEYAKQKELELYNSLMSIANLKQDEIRLMIRETINSIKLELIESIASFSLENTQSSSTQSIFDHSGEGVNNSSRHINGNGKSSSNFLNGLSNGLNCNLSHNNSGGVGNCGANNDANESVATVGSVDTNYHSIHGINSNYNDNVGGCSSGSFLASCQSTNSNSNNNNNKEDQYCHQSVESNSSQLTNLSIQSLENISSRSELQLYRQEIQEFVLHQLNSLIATKLIGSVESLRSSYVGTLERCLASLEQNCIDHNEPPHALLALRQILNAAYRVEVSVQSSTSILRVLWEKMKQLVGTRIPIWSLYWNNYGCCIIDDQWKKQQALDIIENLSESRLAKSICSQFRARLKVSHEQFLQSIKDLELQHAGRLQQTEDLRLRVRKMHAPRMAKFALESTSLIDLILYGMPCLEKEIGRGQYGVVYGCESWAGHSPCAVKSVVPPDDKHWYDLAMEFYYTRCIPEHERIVNIYGSVIDHTYGTGSTPAVLLVMERLNRDLYSAIKSGLDWLSRLQVAIDVVEGIRFLHNQGLVHRDIKLKNILLDANNRAKITDLGFCKPEAMMSGSVVGTPIHMSPELFSGRYDNSVDVYAFGILFWYICAGHVRLPHIFEQCQTRDQLWNCVRRGVRPERLPQFDNECWQLMVQCWDGDRTKRPHLGDVEIRLRQIHVRYT